MASLLLMAFYAVAVAGIPSVDNNPALAGVPSVVYGLLLQSFCCFCPPYTTSMTLLPLAFILSMHFVESLLLLVSHLLPTTPASAFVPTVAGSLYIVFFPAVTGITCMLLPSSLLLKAVFISYSFLLLQASPAF